MKKILYIMLVCFSFSANASDGSDRVGAFNKKLSNDIKRYNANAELCDKAYTNEANEAFSTADMIKSAYNAKNCYEKIIIDIIDNYYSQRANESKEALTNYIKASYDITSDLYMTPDYCLPGCGSQSNIMAKASVVQYLEDLVALYIVRLKMLSM